MCEFALCKRYQKIARIHQENIPSPNIEKNYLGQECQNI